jgi:pantoate--beta-alanine ligase
MELIRTVRDMMELSRRWRAEGKRVGFVPTMGYLHGGHETLMRTARPECDILVVSIFVNPTQFGPNEDFSRYPRDLERDLAICGGVPVDYVFHPTPEEMYPAGSATFVEVERLTAGLCGASRPGHFRGVATVVTKLLNLVKPHKAYFGQKDAQQLAVIRRMVADLFIDTEIVGVPTVREADGLAMSSRNVYLQGPERQAALVLSRALRRAQGMVAAGERRVEVLEAALHAEIAAEPLARLDYARVVDAESLEPITTLERPALCALAVFIGKTRLIDNCELRP